MSDELNKAVDALTQPQRIRVYREDTHHGEWQTLPSLLDQLTSSGQWSGSNNGGGAFGSRPVISTGVVALIIEIEGAVTEAATDFGRIITRTQRINTCYCRPNRACPGYINTTTRDTAAEIRAIAANIPDPDQAVCWTSMLRTWAGQARAALGLNPTRPQWARGTRCPDCQADTAYTQDDERIIRTPALAITWGMPEGEDTDYHEDHDYKIRAIECRACGATWWRGPEMDSLVDTMIAQQSRSA